MNKLVGYLWMSAASMPVAQGSEKAA